MDANFGFIDEHLPASSVAEAEEGLNYSAGETARAGEARVGRSAGGTNGM
jgi:hypothetical protein